MGTETVWHHGHGNGATGEMMTEMEMVRELRRVIAETVGQVGGNREEVRAKIREELVSVVKERFGRGTWPRSE